YHTVASSDDVAAGSGGQKFGPTLVFGLNGNSINDRDDVLLSTIFEPFAGTDVVPNQNTFYIAPAGATPVRIVGLGDTITVSGVPTPFTSFFTPSRINALGQFLFTAGGTVPATGSFNGLFLGSVSAGVGSVTKVAATGDTKPGGGTFSATVNIVNAAALNDL